MDRNEAITAILCTLIISVSLTVFLRGCQENDNIRSKTRMREKIACIQNPNCKTLE